MKPQKETHSRGIEQGEFVTDSEVPNDSKELGAVMDKSSQAFKQAVVDETVKFATKEAIELREKMNIVLPEGEILEV